MVLHVFYRHLFLSEACETKIRVLLAPFAVLGPQMLGNQLCNCVCLGTILSDRRLTSAALSLSSQLFELDSIGPQPF